MKNSNVIIIVVDALRHDFLSCYGYSENKTRNIDFLAENGCMFTNAFTVSGITPAVFSTIFTGTYPFQFERNEFSPVLADKFPTIGEVFSKHGYKTGGILASQVMNKSRGFNRGFEYFTGVD